MYFCLRLWWGAASLSRQYWSWWIMCSCLHNLATSRSPREHGHGEVPSTCCDVISRRNLEVTSHLLELLVFFFSCYCGSRRSTVAGSLATYSLHFFGHLQPPCFLSFLSSLPPSLSIYFILFSTESPSWPPCLPWPSPLPKPIKFQNKTSRWSYKILAAILGNLYNL